MRTDTVSNRPTFNRQDKKSSRRIFFAFEILRSDSFSVIRSKNRRRDA